MQLKLNDRHRQVLGATVRHYVATARPVGSEALLEEFNPRVSSATIRNAMGYLEKVGLLFQPHTSAGRIPSDFGYRIYVDRLVTPSGAIARQADQMLSSQLDMDAWSLESLMRGAAQILASLSGYIVMITQPQSTLAELRHIQLLQVNPGQIMVIVVTDAYETESAVMTVPDLEDDSTPDPEVTEREIQILSNFLNTHLRGRSIGEIATLDWSELGREFERYSRLLCTSLEELHRRKRNSVSPQLLITGVAEVLRRQPEFSELQQVQTILHLLESEQDQLWALIFESVDQESSSGRRVTVRIGAENPLEPMRTCALVSATYCRDKVPVGSVGILGPTRMVYEDAIALVETTADYLSDAITQTS